MLKSPVELRHTELYQKALQLFIHNNIEESILCFKTIIEYSPSQQIYIFQGLGCHQEQMGYFRGKEQEWFIRQYIYKELRVSSYDGLSLCFSIDCKYEQATKWYLMMIDKYPEIWQLHYGLANVYSNNNNYHAAEQKYKQVIEINPHFAKSYLMLAFINNFHNHQIQKTQWYLQKVISLNFSSMQTQFMQVILSPQQNQIQCLKKLIVKYPEYTRIQNNLGRVYLACHDYEKAMECFKNCLKMNPIYSTPLFNISLIYLELKQYEKCIIAIKQCLQIDQYLYFCYPFLAKIYYFYMNDFQSALKYSQQGLKYNGSKVAINYLLAQIYNSRKQLNKSIYHLQKCIQLSPNTALYYCSIGIIYENLKQYQQAIFFHTKCILIEPQNIRSINGLADSYYFISNYEKSAQFYQNLRQLMGQEQFAPIFYCRQAYCLSMTNKQSESIKLMEQAIANNQQKNYLYSFMGQLCFTFKRYEMAISSFERVKVYFQNEYLYYESNQHTQQAENLLNNYLGNSQEWRNKQSRGIATPVQQAKIKMKQQLLVQVIQNLFK